MGPGAVGAGAIGCAPLGGLEGHAAVAPVCGCSVGHGNVCASQRHATSTAAEQMTAASDLDLIFRIPRFPFLPTWKKDCDFGDKGAILKIGRLFES